jgi:hypothetical protein
MRFETVTEAAEALQATNEKFVQSRTFRLQRTPAEAMQLITDLQDIATALIQLHTIELKKRSYRNQ